MTNQVINHYTIEVSVEKISKIIKLIKTKRILIVTLLGFSSGLPIMIVYQSLKLWLRRYDVDLSTIGYFSWIAVPYSFNFAWSFLFDRFIPFKKFGKRRSWLLITQICLSACFFLLAQGDPNDSLIYIVVVGFFLCFFSASQDIAVDAYRNEILDKEELGIGASFGVYGYRIGMWVASGFCIWVVDKSTWDWSFNQMFLLLSALMSIGILTTFFADEPKGEATPPKNIYDSIILPFKEFFSERRGLKHSLAILFFIFLFKLGDSVAGSMARPFYADLGFSNKEIGEIAATLGLFSSLLGLFIGGSLIFQLGQLKALWVTGILQALSTGCYALLTLVPTKLSFSFIVFFEDFSSGMGTAALVAFMGALVNKKFTATQYALFASLASLGRTLFSGLAGDLILALRKISPHIANSGYAYFFMTCMILAIPGLVALFILQRAEAKAKN